MPNHQPYHILIGESTWCEYTGCQAGLEINSKVNGGKGVACSHPSRAEARRAAQMLRPHFRHGAVKLVPGHCKHV